MMDKNRNKIISVVLIVLCVALIILALVIVKKYSAGSDNNPENNVTDDVESSDKTDMSDNNVDNVSERMIKTNPAKEEKNDNDKITPKTQLIMQTYYIDARNHDNLEESKENMPSELIAMSEDELEDYLEDYMDDIPLNEYLDGLLSYEVIEFSKDKVILRKTYAADWNENEYYLCDVDGYVVVYYSDKETVFEYTGIKTADLSSEEQVRLKIGYYVSDEEELYALLESYSS